MSVPRLVTFLVVALLGAMFTAPAVIAKPLPSVSVDLIVDASDCSAVVLTANVEWQKITLTAYPDYMIEWFAVTSFSQTLGTSAFDPGKRAGKSHGAAETSFTRDGSFDASIYTGANYSASLRFVVTGLVVATSNSVPIPDCAQAAPDATATQEIAGPDMASPDITSPDTDSPDTDSPDTESPEAVIQ